MRWRLTTVTRAILGSIVESKGSGGTGDGTGGDCVTQQSIAGSNDRCVPAAIDGEQSVGAQEVRMLSPRWPYVDAASARDKD